MNRFILAFSVLLLSSCMSFPLSSKQLSAAEKTADSSPATKETIEELFDVTKTEKMMDVVYGQMDVIFKKMVQDMNISESQKPIMDKFFVKYAALVKQELSWEKLKDPMVEAYASVYSEGEVKEFIGFYKTPAGQKMLAKTPELMLASMGMVQTLMKNLMPQITELQKELENELKEDAKRKHNSNNEVARIHNQSDFPL